MCSFTTVNTPAKRRRKRRRKQPLKCYGCPRRLPAAELPYGPRKKRRCGACQRSATRWRQRTSGRVTGLPKCRVCERDHCGARGSCFLWSPKPGGHERWLCVTCLRVAELPAGRVVSHDRTKKTTKKQASLLAAKHLVQWMLVDLWLVPTGPTCLYWLVRIIMWCREGRLAAMPVFSAVVLSCDSYSTTALSTGHAAFR